MELVAEVHPGSLHVTSRGHVIDTRLGYSGDLIQLRNLNSVDNRTSDGTFFKRAADHPNRFLASRANEYGEFVTEIPETTENFTHVQELPGTKWLLVRSRADNNDDLNAAIFDEGGRCIKRLHFGDGIADLQTTRDGSIWVSYFDEGIFGDISLGRSGVVKLSAEGDVVVRLDQIDSGLVLADCYAMNVIEEDCTWVHYYIDFPLIKVHGEKIEERYDNLGVHGAHGFAIFQQWVLLGGSYDDSMRLSLIDLTRRDRYDVDVIGPTGKLLKPIQLFARGSMMCVVADEFYIVNLMKWRGPG